MNDYYSIRIDMAPCSEDATDLMAAYLAEIDFESFVPDESGLTAYVKKESYDQGAVEAIFDDFPMPCDIKMSATLVPGQDWNEEWEKNYFQPIVIGDQCVIHSTFHHDVPKAHYDIVIDPKMAFGTGHHDTTSLLIQKLLQMDLEGESVIDMGTGTGILAILAAMRGAMSVVGIEIDGFAYENAIENVKLNGHGEIQLINGDAAALEKVSQADVFIANINRNVILADMAAYAKAIKPGGTILLSGFYAEDVDMLLEKAKTLDLMFVEAESKEETRWTMLQLEKKS